MEDILVRHWSLLDGSVHPADATVFASARHSFNLDFPPPAFIGDVLNAPIILLEANGGYDPVVTPQEFPDAKSVERYLGYLRDPRPVHPETIAPYYGRRNYARHITSGKIALVNAVAYRSVGISREPANKRLSEQLPSTQVHRDWLRNTLMPQAALGERLVIAHRNALWKLRKNEAPLSGVIFTTNPVSADLSNSVLEEIDHFLVPHS